jgi:peptidyl-prolyl cis-trans isomerase A (cyclophilin A)
MSVPWEKVGVALLCATQWFGVVAAQEVAVQDDAVQVPAPALVNVVMHTGMGDITLALEKDRAPATVDNFLKYVDAKRFDGIDFYRAVKIGDDGMYGLVQGGIQGNRTKAFKPIAHEAPSATGLSHLNGAVSMARGDPGSATADFFIVVGDLVALDGQATGDDLGYAVFGRVTAGMEVVRQILELPRQENAGEGAMKGQMLAAPVKVLTTRRVE